MAAHDIAPMRVCRRDALLALDVRDRRFGYPVELLQTATPRRLAGHRARRRLPPARGGHPVQGVRLGARHRAHRPRLLAGARVSGRARAGGRQGAGAGPGEDPARRRRSAMAAAAEVAAAALLDTLAACRDGVRRRALPARARRRPRRRRARRRAIARALAGWTVSPQRGDGFAERLVNAHADVPRRPGRSCRSAWTPRSSPPRPAAAAARRARRRTTPCSARPRTAAGGCSALRDPAARAALHDVPMSTPTTYDDTRRALRGRRPAGRRPPRRCATSTPSRTPTRWPRSRRTASSPAPGGDGA